MQVVSGMYYSCGITLEQSVHCWGRLPEQTIDGLYSQITGGKHFACGVLTDGKINCWGFVNDAIKAHMPTPAFMAEHDLSRFVQVSCEDTHCCALDDKGHARCWGEELMYGSMKTPRERTDSAEALASPEEGSDSADFYGFQEEAAAAASSRLRDDALTNVVFKQISVGYQFSCGIRYGNGDLLCWGHVDSLRIGSSGSEHLVIKGPFKQVAAGVLGACALYEDGTQPALCLGAAKFTMTKYAVEYDQIGVSTTMICGVNMDNSQLECSGWNRNIAAATPHGLEIA